eukprot:TRINITY_DN25179_c0_g2_i1.p1 TRINITY_DN25179_c0_g2~~TRINITY_DN25179_c0_g2_i1.p1  ORF type:complete len:402 (-),score=35.76 TRINITY_DN25179_c0_g2_i1:40-1167(-)
MAVVDSLGIGWLVVLSIAAGACHGGVSLRSVLPRWASSLGVVAGRLGHSSAAFSLLPVLLYACLFACIRLRLAQPKHVVTPLEDLQSQGRDALEARARHRTVERRVLIPTVDGRGSIEAIVVTPSEEVIIREEASSPDPHPHGQRFAVVCTHPWAALGGNLQNNVPAKLSRFLAACGHVAIRFNFRGMGISRGTNEVADVRTAARYLLDAGYLDSKSADDCSLPVDRSGRGTTGRLLLVGYSYGSLITSAAAAADDLGDLVAACVTISPPWPFAWALSLFNSDWILARAATAVCPQLFVVGTSDVFTSIMSFQRTLRSRFGAPSPKVSSVVVGDADHFWIGQEAALFATIDSFLLRLRNGALEGEDGGITGGSVN